MSDRKLDNPFTSHTEFWEMYGEELSRAIRENNFTDDFVFLCTNGDGPRIEIHYRNAGDFRSHKVDNTIYLYPWIPTWERDCWIKRLAQEIWDRAPTALNDLSMTLAKDLVIDDRIDRLYWLYHAFQRECGGIDVITWIDERAGYPYKFRGITIDVAGGIRSLDNPHLTVLDLGPRITQRAIRYPNLPFP